MNNQYCLRYKTICLYNNRVECNSEMNMLAKAIILNLNKIK